MQLKDRPEAAVAPANDAAHAIFALLRDWEIDLVFTCPGSTEAAVLDASLAFPEMRLILTTHESIAVAAADGYARVTGRPAVAYLHANVGLANGVAHLTCASNAHSPVVILNGLKSTAITNRDGFTTSPFQQDYVRQLVKRSRVALKTDGIPGDLSRTLQAAVSEPTGPVYLGLPQDLVDAPLTGALPPAQRRRFPARRRPDPVDVAAAAERLAAGQAVTIVAGSEIAFNAAARAALTALAERLQAPILLEDRRSMQAAAILGDHPAFAGSYVLSHPAVAGADVLLYAGMYSFVEFEEQRGAFQPPGAQIVHLCSDPAQIGKLADVDVALAGNAELGLLDLHAALGPVTSAARAAHRASALAAHRSATDARRSAQRARYADVPIDPRVLVEALHELLPREAFILNDGVTSGSYLTEAVIADAAREHLTAAGGSLSWGMGAAIGVQLARPQARVVDVVGDGSFQFGVQALFTAVRLQLPITYVVIDNESYAAVRAALKRRRKGAPEAAYPASDLRGPDIAAIARGFGAHAETVARIADLRGALDRAFAAAGPAVVVVKTDPAHTGP
ncbi:MAG: thiamine pyrophosphate-dependent enzyme [Candidatus Lustribacter sp.]|jgi:thiamine pyrophosphate-dependent acetolactate synthase large subunit-like protein